MGKILITDEINDQYTATVTPQKRLRVEDGASNFLHLSSAHTLVPGQRVSTAACYLKSIIFGMPPATATQVNIYDTTDCASALSAFGTSGSNIIGLFAFEPSAGALSGDQLNFPKVIPLGVYCASGVTVSIGCSAAADVAGRIGAMRGITVVYTQ